MEGLMVVFLYDLGKILEEKAINNSKKSINDIINIKQDYANLICKNETKKIDVEEIKIGDLLLVKKGEKIPVDGVIEKGTAVLDTSSLTGESEFVNSKKGDQVLSSTINVGELIIIRATKIYNDSTVAKILDLVMNATDKKAKTETMVSKISKYYTPLIVLLALIVLIILPFFGVSIEDSLYRSLTFLVISCPCAIAISVPLSYFTGIGVSSKRGILIKGSNYLDNLSKIEAIVFDKTGTITNGSFTIKSIDILDKKYSKEKVLEILAKGESFSNHPIAKAILKLCLHAKTKDVKNYKEITGEGISFEINKDKIIIGTQKICNCNIINTNLHLNINGKHIASIIVDDGIKKEASKVINYLNNNGIMTYMFTGDKKDLALDVGKKINIGEINYEMLPTDKYQKLELLKKKYQMLAFVGDGINDAPVLKLADIGISMGNLGQSSAIEASDIVIMNDNLEKIIESINISKYTNKIIRENLIFALGVKILILILSIFGLVNMWFAVFADTGVTILTILNTLRILTFINDKKNK
jgi:Cd2+/Zn2+-exporting ATPase